MRKYFVDVTANQSTRNMCIRMSRYMWIVFVASTSTHKQNTRSHTTNIRIHIIHGCNMLNGIYKETNACYIYDLFILCCNFRARQPNYAKRTCFSVACVSPYEVYIGGACVHIGRPSASSESNSSNVVRITARTNEQQTNDRSNNQTASQPANQLTELNIPCVQFPRFMYIRQKCGVYTHTANEIECDTIKQSTENETKIDREQERESENAYIVCEWYEFLWFPQLHLDFVFYFCCCYSYYYVQSTLQRTHTFYNSSYSLWSYENFFNGALQNVVVVVGNLLCQVIIRVCVCVCLAIFASLISALN